MECEQLRLYDWCASCNRHETALEGDVYKYCLECGHIWKTAQELVEAYNREVDAINSADGTGLVATYVETADQVYFCPLCLHDFLP